MNRLNQVFAWLRYVIPGCLICADEKLQKDLVRWKQICKLNTTDKMAMAWLLWKHKEFRNLVIYRHGKYPVRRRLIAVFYPPLESLCIDALEIGGGLFIHHGIATIIAAKSIGENCWINQQVTIGYKDAGEPPVIGNNVMITCGAKVLGSIYVGDGAVIGANAVVVKDIPARCVVGGIPAKIIKRDI